VTCHWRRKRCTPSRALRVGFWSSARLVKGAARPWVCLRLGAAVLGSARRRTARGGGVQASGERLACAAPAARTPVHSLSGRLRLAGACWARLARGLVARRGCSGVGAASLVGARQGRAGALPASGLACARCCSRGARTAALALGMLAPSSARLMAPWEAFAEWCDAGAASCV
jgi:hypothetical protein